MHDVFISYCTADYARADHVRRVLEEAGFRCWFAPRSIRGSQDFTNEIPPAIAGSRAFLLIMTAEAQRSKWVKRELGEADAGNKPIFVMMLDEYELSEQYRFMLRYSQRYPFSDGFEKQMQRLLADLGEELKRPFSLPKIRPLPKRRGRGGLIPLALAAAAAAALLLWPKDAAPDQEAGSRPLCGAVPTQSAAQTAAEAAERHRQRLEILADAAKQEGDPMDAMAVIRAGLRILPDDPVLTAAHDHWGEAYAAGVCARARAQWDGGDILAALDTVRQARELLPDSPALDDLLGEICAEDPIPVTGVSVSTQISPDDGLTAATWYQWDPETDRDICMERWSGGLEMRVNRLFAGMLFVDNEVTFRMSYAFEPADHTATEFEGYLVLHEDMYDSRTRGTIRILVDGQEVFSTGQVDGSCRESFPFRIDITGVDAIVIEAQVALYDQDPFAFGMVSAG